MFLSWWKLNSGRFLILSNMASDLLAILISTVSFESAFSTGGRVLDPHHSSFTPRMVEAVVCTQYWIKSTNLPLSSNENESFEILEQFEHGNKIIFFNTLLHYVLFVN